MEPLAILIADPLDILFDNRNKNYGAYPLRKFYQRRLSVALFSSLSAGILFFYLLTTGPQPMLATTVILTPDYVVITPPLPAINPKRLTIPRRMVQVASVNDAPIRIVRDKEADKPMHTIAELAEASSGTSDIPGPPDAGNVTAVSAGDAGAVTMKPETVTEPEVFKRADVMPQFPGGQEALLRFLTRNLRMPENAAAGTKVSVLATFVVGADGKVSRTAMMRSGGERFDAEVMRVLSKMPSWIPGRMGNRAVPVYFTLPVQFVVPDE